MTVANGAPNGRRKHVAPAGAVDLSRASLSEDEAREAQEMLELQLGERCNGCGRRMGLGFAFTSIDPRNEHPVMRLSACSRPDCGYAEACRDGATCMEMVEFVWLDEMGIDAPAMTAIVKRNERLAAQRDQGTSDPPSGAVE